MFVENLFSVFKYGYVLFWIYVIFIFLHLTKLMEIGRFRFLIILCLVLVTCVFYTISYMAQYP
jgi:hypothetical protein